MSMGQFKKYLGMKNGVEKVEDSFTLLLQDPETKVGETGSEAGILELC